MRMRLPSSVSSKFSVSSPTKPIVSIDGMYVLPNVNEKLKFCVLHITCKVLCHYVCGVSRMEATGSLQAQRQWYVNLS